MKILLTADPELPVPPKLYGGIERIIDVLVRRLRARGHTVALCAHDQSTTSTDALFAWPGKASWGQANVIANMRTLKSAVRTWKPDVLHSFSRLAYMAPLLRSRLPKIMSYQREPNGRTTGWANWLAGGSLQFTGCSEHICRGGRAAGGRWTAIHNCVELEVYQPQEHVNADAPLVFLSRIERIKGAHTAIEIARRTGRRLLIAGNRIGSGAGAEYWKHEIEPHLNDRIEYVGPVDDAGKNRLLGGGIAMLVPIEWDEPFGIVFAESLACGTPVISCPRGSLPEIVVPGKHGYLIDSIDAGVEAVSKLGDLSRAECRSRAEAMFSADVIVSQYEALYEQAIASSRRTRTTGVAGS